MHKWHMIQRPPICKITTKHVMQQIKNENNRLRKKKCILTDPKIKDLRVSRKEQGRKLQVESSNIDFYSYIGIIKWYLCCMESELLRK